MKQIFIVFLALGLMCINYGFSQEVTPDERGYIVEIGDKVEDFSMQFLDGSTMNLSEFNKKVIVLNFFASWCVVCRKEIPHIEKELWEQMKNDSVLVIGVDYKEDEKTTRKFVEEMKITYPVILDKDGKIFERFARGGVTRNIVIDNNMNIIFLTRLFDRTEFDEMLRVVRNGSNSNFKLLKEENKGVKIMSFGLLKDLTNSGKEIALEYHGEHKIHLEGRIKDVQKRKTEIGVSLFQEDIISKKFDKKLKTLKIGYRHYDGVRIAVLPMTSFTVPSDVEKVIIYDEK